MRKLKCAGGPATIATVLYCNHYNMPYYTITYRTLRTLQMRQLPCFGSFPLVPTNRQKGLANRFPWQNHVALILFKAVLGVVEGLYSVCGLHLVYSKTRLALEPHPKKLHYTIPCCLMLRSKRKKLTTGLDVEDRRFEESLLQMQYPMKPYNAPVVI